MPQTQLTQLHTFYIQYIMGLVKSCMFLIVNFHKDKLLLLILVRSVLTKLPC